MALSSEEDRPSKQQKRKGRAPKKEGARAARGAGRGAHEKKKEGNGEGAGAKRTRAAKKVEGKDDFWADLKQAKGENPDDSSSAEEWHGSESSVSMEDDVNSSDLEVGDEEAMHAKYFSEYLAYARQQRYPDPATIPRFVHGRRVPTELDRMLGEDEGEQERMENDMIFVAGGYFGPVVPDLDKPAVLADVERYSPHEQSNGVAKWRGVPAMQTPRSNHALCALGGKIYAIGGQAHDGGDVSIGGLGPVSNRLGEMAKNTVVSCEPVRCKEPYYDLDTVESLEIFPRRENGWRFEPSLSRKRIGLAAATMGGRIYAAGGFDGNSFLGSVESFGEGDRKWRQEPSMTTERHGHAMTTLGDRLYVVGGHDSDRILDSVEFLELGAGQWVAGPSLRNKRHYPALAACRFTGRIYALGGWAIKRSQEWDERLGKYVPSGEVEYDTQTSVESLDPREGKWRPEPSMNTRRMYHAAACCGSSLYAMGGCDEDGEPTDSVERLDLRMPGGWVPDASLQMNRTYTAATALFLDPAL